ncbi:MAG: tetratricopeptide repeat protein [Gemmatimonadota bacterium]
MPNIASFHPVLVHVVIVLGIVGVICRLVSLTGLMPWTRPAGTWLILIAAASGYLAAESGHQAHGPVERVPGSREAVQEHEEAGELARNLFFALAAIELVALALRRKEKAQKMAYILSGVVGLGAAYAVFEAGEHGGDLVYNYAGGVGLRTGDTTDVRRLLIAGLYHESQAARKAGNKDEAARLTEELARQVPGDANVRMMVVESQLSDRGDARGALDALNAMPAPGDNPRAEVQIGALKGEAYIALGQPDSARAILQALKQKYPDSRMVDEALKKIL